jgi:hypothetical protein
MHLKALDGDAANADNRPFFLCHTQVEALVCPGAGKKIGGAIKDKLNRPPHDALAVQIDEGIVILVPGIPDDNLGSQ